MRASLWRRRGSTPGTRTAPRVALCPAGPRSRSHAGFRAAGSVLEETLGLKECSSLGEHNSQRHGQMRPGQPRSVGLPFGAPTSLVAWAQSHQGGHLLLAASQPNQVLGVGRNGGSGRPGEAGCQEEGGWELAQPQEHQVGPRASRSPLQEDHGGWLRSCCLSHAALCLSHSVSLPVPSLLLVFPEKKVQFQRSVNGECPSSSSMLILLGLSTCSSLPPFLEVTSG